MKHILIVDTPPMFREFIKDKLSEEKLEITYIQEKRDAITKMISTLPDLVVMNIDETEDFEYLTDLLQDIHNDPNAGRIPIIATGPILDRNYLASFAHLGIVKYFVKPIKFDVFFESIGSILKMTFNIDTTPCVLDIHRNGNIVFIEIAQGLNREKITLLKYSLSEIIEKDKLDNPKIVIMMTALDLTFVDGLNLELLFDNILAAPKIHAKNVKVLSLSTFTRDLIDGHRQYDGIEVVTDISQVLTSLVESNNTSRVSDLITDNILTNTETDAGSIEMRFSSDTKPQEDKEEAKSAPQATPKPPQPEKKLTVAVVDDDQITQKLLAAGFISANFNCDVFNNGIEFLTGLNQKRYDVIILDILMPGLSGFDTLKRLQGMVNRPPIIIYSQAMRRELVIQCLALGAKQFLVKPQKPELIVKKAMELINARQ
ncbi:MAG: response regulator [Treponema sp.]|nr:response regulator [Treponema sp.]